MSKPVDILEMYDEENKAYVKAYDYSAINITDVKTTAAIANEICDKVKQAVVGIFSDYQSIPLTTLAVEVSRVGSKLKINVGMVVD